MKIPILVKPAPKPLPIALFQRPTSRGYETVSGTLCEIITFAVVEGEGVPAAKAGNYRGHLLGRSKTRVLGNSYLEDSEIAMHVFLDGYASKL